jgi:hypothetical protein
MLKSNLDKNQLQKLIIRLQVRRNIPFTDIEEDQDYILDSIRSSDTAACRQLQS